MSGNGIEVRIDSSSVARMLLLQKGLVEVLADVTTATKGTAKTLMELGDTKTGWDTTTGTPINLGKVQFKNGATTVKVTNEPALIEWLKVHAPHMLAFPEDPTPLAHALTLAEGMELLDPDDGEDEALDVIVAAARRLLAVLYDQSRVAIRPASLKALKDAVKQDGGWEMPETGEIVDVPGLELVQGDTQIAVETNKQTIGGVVSRYLEGSGLKVIEQ